MTEFNTYEETILVFVLVRKTELAGIENPYFDELKRVELAREGWVSYKPSEWNGERLPAADRREYVKALVSLERGGLVEVFRDRTNRPTWLRLREAGTTAAKELAEKNEIELTPIATSISSPASPTTGGDESIGRLARELEDVRQQLTAVEDRLIKLEAGAG